MKKVIQKFYNGKPLESHCYSSIISERHFKRLIGFLNLGKIIIGGEYDEPKLRISPTIIDEVTWDYPIMQEEIFGPLLPVLDYENILDIVDVVNRHPKPLALYIFSCSHKFQNTIIRSTSSGGVCINDILSHISTDSLPFGGVGDSGMGSYHGEKSFTVFTHEKSVMRKSSWFDLKLVYPPYMKLNSFLKRVISLFS